MRKNQKYSEEEMFKAIELWNESGLSQVKFCTYEKLSVKSFCYWLRKYKKGKGHPAVSGSELHQKFIPVKVSQLSNNHITGYGSDRNIFSQRSTGKLSCRD